VIELDGKQFSPVTNSEGGRVRGDAIFTFSQSGSAFTADYSGSGFTNGHLIGNMTSANTAELVYHSRAEDHALEVGQAEAEFSLTDDNKIKIAMNWRWLNGSLKSGQSIYKEL